MRNNALSVHFHSVLSDMNKSEDKIQQTIIFNDVYKYTILVVLRHVENLYILEFLMFPCKKACNRVGETIQWRYRSHSRTGLTCQRPESET